MDIVSQGSVAVILLLRTCALWNHNIYIIISLGVPVLGIGAIGFSWSLIVYIISVPRGVAALERAKICIAPVAHIKKWYFFLLCLVYYMLLLYANQPSIKELIGVGNYIARSISVNILSRFLLDIQEAVQPKYSQCPPTLVSPSIQFLSMSPITSPNPNPLGPNGEGESSLSSI
ncbi:hypothetical protein BU17DRAFT_64019 [Hysterangium stoloniferum]|nr:hypothetical protein BU17DRAFT_64019 [Hysterangium stoloniferum]